jgi:hypothetical protein
MMPNFSGADYGSVTVAGQCSAIAAWALSHSGHRLDGAQESADKAPMRATHIRAVNILCGIIATS